MRAYQQTLNGQITLADQVRTIRIETSSGMILSITEEESGSVRVAETTHYWLGVQPWAANAVTLSPVMPESFRSRVDGK